MALFIRIFFIIAFGGSVLIADSPALILNSIIVDQRKMPDILKMSKICTDPANDQTIDFLDLTEGYFAFSQQKIYVCMKNRGKSFSTSGKLGSQYYSYMAVIAFDQKSDIVWALNYINAPLGGLKPGLYKIKGLGKSDLQHIANIDYYIDPKDHLLKMSCNIADLISDSDFKKLYNAQKPSISMTFMTHRTHILPFKTERTDSDFPGQTIYMKFK